MQLDDTLPNYGLLRDLLAEVLNLDERWLNDELDTPLLGAVPQLDSMAAVSLLTQMESTFGIRIDDQDVGAEMFATFGSLLDFVNVRALANAGYTVD